MHALQRYTTALSRIEELDSAPMRLKIEGLDLTMPSLTSVLSMVESELPLLPVTTGKFDLPFKPDDLQKDMVEISKSIEKSTTPFTSPAGLRARGSTRYHPRPLHVKGHTYYYSQESITVKCYFQDASIHGSQSYVLALYN